MFLIPSMAALPSAGCIVEDLVMVLVLVLLPAMSVWLGRVT